MATKLTGPEIKANRAAAEITAGYTSADRALIGGKTTEVVATAIYDNLLVGNLDEASLMARALAKREKVNFLTFHPDGK